MLERQRPHRRAGNVQHAVYARAIHKQRIDDRNIIRPGEIGAKQRRDDANAAFKQMKAAA